MDDRTGTRKTRTVPSGPNGETMTFFIAADGSEWATANAAQAHDDRPVRKDRAVVCRGPVRTDVLNEGLTRREAEAIVAKFREIAQPFELGQHGRDGDRFATVTSPAGWMAGHGHASTVKIHGCDAWRRWAVPILKGLSREVRNAPVDPNPIKVDAGRLNTALDAIGRPDLKVEVGQTVPGVEVVASLDPCPIDDGTDHVFMDHAADRVAASPTRRDPARIGTITIGEGDIRRRGYEVAAWYDRVELDPGTYDVIGTLIDGRPITDADPKPYWVSYAVPGTIIESYTPSLYGGVVMGPGNGDKRVGERTTFAVSSYPWTLGTTLPWTLDAGWMAVTTATVRPDGTSYDTTNLVRSGR